MGTATPLRKLPPVKTTLQFLPELGTCLSNIFTSRAGTQQKVTNGGPFSACFPVFFDDGQIAHLICARLKYDLYDFFRGVFLGLFLQEKEQEAGPKHPLKKSYRSYFRLVTGKSLDSPEKGNVDKMSEKCPKNVEKLSRGAETHNFRTFFGQFLPIWSMLLFGDPVQCVPVTILGGHRFGQN